MANLPPLKFLTGDPNYVDYRPAVDASGIARQTARKLHLPLSDAAFSERDHFHPGEALGVHRVGTLSFGCLVCYDRRFPEPWRALRGLGAALALIPVVGPGGDDSSGNCWRRCQSLRS